MALVITPTILLIIPLIGVVSEPSLLLEYWDFYLLLVGLPYLLAAALWLISKRMWPAQPPKKEV